MKSSWTRWKDVTQIECVDGFTHGWIPHPEHASKFCYMKIYV